MWQGQRRERRHRGNLARDLRPEDAQRQPEQQPPVRPEDQDQPQRKIRCRQGPGPLRGVQEERPRCSRQGVQEAREEECWSRQDELEVGVDARCGACLKPVEWKWVVRYDMVGSCFVLLA